MAAEEVTLEYGNVEVKVSNPSKVFFEQGSLTKLDLIDYYEEVKTPLLLAMKDRPILMQRFPNGASGSSFFQKRVPSNAPDWLQTTTVSTPNGTKSTVMVVANFAHVVWAVNLGCLGFHVWPFKVTHPDVTDELRIDLDPGPGVEFKQVVEAALKTKELLDELDLTCYLKTSGNKGLHVYIYLKPKWDSYKVRQAAVAFARELERRHPDLVTAAWWKEERGKRVFIDYNQNAPHKTIFGAWSVRAKENAQVSTPLFWDELPGVAPEDFTIQTVPGRLESLGDPWADVSDPAKRDDLTVLLDMYQQDMDAGLMDAPWPPQYAKQPNEPTRVQPSRAKKPDPNS